MTRIGAPTLLHMGEPHCGERANRMFALGFGAKQGLHSDKVRMSRAQVLYRDGLMSRARRASRK